jgi:hypothetical protein
MGLARIAGLERHGVTAWPVLNSSPDHIVDLQHEVVGVAVAGRLAVAHVVSVAALGRAEL